MPRTQRLGLEFLIRKPRPDGGAGFELRESDPGQVWIRLRPRRVTGVAVEENVVDEATGRVFLLRNASTESYLRLTEPEYFLWQRIDGAHSIQDLAAAWAFEFGSFEFNRIPLFLNKVRRFGVIEMPRGGLARTRPAEKPGRLGRLLARIGRLDWRLDQVDGFFTALSRVARPLVSFPAMAALGLLGLAGAVLYVLRRWSDGFGAADAPFLAWLGALVLLLLPSLALHELAHGATCRAFGRRVKAVGLTFVDRFVPSAYVDVTDVWMGPRRARITVSLAGPALNLVLAALASAGALAAASGGAPWAAWWLRTLADANLVIVAWTLWPFGGVQSDGYHALSDAVRVSALRARAFRKLRALLGSAPPGPTGAGAALTLYLTGTLLTWAAVIIAVMAHNS